MVEVYFYMPADRAENVTECGMKLSEWYDREINIDGAYRKCISTLLNPRDDIAAYKSQNCRCIKLEVNSKYCYVADGFLYRMCANRPEIMKMYEESIVPVEEYRFGKYRMPECLVTCTVVGNSISLLDRRRDTPILFSSSEELYFNNVVEGFREEHDDFNDAILFYLLNALADAGSVKKVVDEKTCMAIFVEEKCGRVFTVKVPDIAGYH